jgi:hypothetical protein
MRKYLRHRSLPEKQALLAIKYDRRKLFAVFLVVLAAQITDLTIGNLADVMKDFAGSFWGVTIFITVAAICSFGQYFILALVRAKNKGTQIKKANLSKLEVAVFVAQCLLISLLVFLVLQIIFDSQYYTFLLILGSAISYGLAACLMAILGYLLFSWFRINKTLVVLLYGLGAVVTALNVVDIAVIFGTLLQSKDIIISPHSEVIFVMADPILNTIQGVSAVLIFILLWSGTILLLYHNLQKVGKIKFWTLVTTPLIFFASFFISYFGVLNFGPPEDPANIVIPVLAILSSTIVGLVLFGLAFHSVAWSLGSSQVKDFMTITGYGLILFFTASNTTIAGTGYPPFGFVNVVLVGPLSFLILSALYRSAITVAQDAKLRQSLRISLRKEVKLLDSIGRSEMQKEIENKVFIAVKKNADILKHESGVEPSLTVEEMQDLLESTLKRIRKDDKKGPR